jgi:uncharacterized protein (TIGR00369 family)
MLMETWLLPGIELPARLPSYDTCFVCGQENPVGLHIMFFAQPDQTVSAAFELKDAYAGYEAVVHGGVVSAFLDELAGWAVSLRNGLLACTAELTVRFVAPVRPGKRHIGRAAIGRGRGRLWEAEGSLSDEDGRVCAWAAGKYFLLTAEQTAEVAARMTWHGGNPREEMVRSMPGAAGQ